MAPLLLCLVLQDLRVTLELHDVPLIDAARQALAPFGHSTSWIRKPQSERRVTLTLKDAGYFQALDAICERDGGFKADSVYHPAIQLALLCGNASMSRRTIGVLDLRPDLRLLIVRVDDGASAPHVEVDVILPPGATMRSGCLVNLAMNGHSLPAGVSLRGPVASPGYPVRFSGWLPAPAQRPGESFRVAGDLVVDDASGPRRLAFATDWAVLLPHPEAQERPRAGFWVRHQPAWLLLGLALGVALILWSIAHLRPAGVTN